MRRRSLSYISPIFFFNFLNNFVAFCGSTMYTIGARVMFQHALEKRNDRIYHLTLFTFCTIFFSFVAQSGFGAKAPLFIATRKEMMRNLKIRVGTTRPDYNTRS